MGNQLGVPARPTPDMVAEVPGLVFKEALGECVGEAGARQGQRQRGPPTDRPPTHSLSLTHTGGGRVLKSALCVHDDAGLVVVKVREFVCVCVGSGHTRPVIVCFFPHFLPFPPHRSTKSGATPSLCARMSKPCWTRGERDWMRKRKRREAGRASFFPHLPPTPFPPSDRLAHLPFPHALAPSAILDTPAAAYIVRPHAHASLRSRLGTRPFLSRAQRAWCAFQATAALADAHAAGVVHGDIKPENVLLTSGGWLLLADPAPHKPGALPADDTADYSAFFDAGGTRACYVAPERFVAGGGGLDTARRRSRPVSPAADVFALGCVLAEVCAGHTDERDGGVAALPPSATTTGPLFDLASLLAYRAGGDPPTGLARVDAPLRSLVAAMVSCDPAARPTAAAAAARAAAALPSVFTTRLHSLWRDVLSLDGDGRVTAVLGEWDAMQRGEAEGARDGGEKSGAAATPTTTTAPASLDASTVARDVGGLLADTQTLLARLESAHQDRSAVSTPPPPDAPPADAPASPPSRPPPPTIDATAATLMTWLVASCLRGAPSADVRARGVRALAGLAAVSDDATRVDAALPYALALLTDPAASVRYAAVGAVADVLSATSALLSRGAGAARALLADVVLPGLAPVPTDPAECVRVAAAADLARIAVAAWRLADGGGGGDGDASAPPINTAFLTRAVERALHDLAVGPASSPATRRALLPRLGALASALGRREANDFVLPAAITFLNDRDPALRAAFFRHGPALAAAAGPGGLEAFLLPCAETALTDAHPSVAAAALGFLAHAAASPDLRRRPLLAVARRALPGALARDAHPAVRAAGARFVAAAATALRPAEAAALLGPIVEAAAGKAPSCLTDAAAVAACLGDGGSVVPPRTSLPPTLAATTDAPLLAVVTGGPMSATTTGVSALTAALAASASLAADSPVPTSTLSPPTDTLSRAARRVPPPGGALADLLADDYGGASFYGAPLPPQPTAASAAAVGAAAAADLAPAAPADPWRPRGVAVAHMAEHTAAINGLAVAGGRLLATACADGAARVWDGGSLEKAASLRSAAAYGGQGGVAGGLTCIAPVGTDAFATGAGDGSVHVWRVERAGGAPRGGAPTRAASTSRATVLTLDEGAITTALDWPTGRALLFATARGGVAAWDARAAPRPAWRAAPPPRDGAVTAVAVDPLSSTWFVTGTCRGSLALWDARLLLPVVEWALPGRPRVDAAAAATAPPPRCGVRGDPPAGPLVYVAAGGEASIWDVVTGVPRGVLRVGGGAPGAAAGEPAVLGPPPAAPTPTAADPVLPDRGMGGVNCLLPSGAGPILTGGGDGCVRLWDGARPEESYTVAGDPEAMTAAAASSPRHPGFATPPPALATHASPLPPPSAPRASIYARRLVRGVPVVDEVPCAAPAPPPAGSGGGPGLVEPQPAGLAHRDAVLALAEVAGGDGGRLLVSASRDGVVKVWR